MDWMRILGAIAAALIVFYMVKVMRGNKQLFSKENFSKSLSSMGVLALILIAFVAFLIMMLRSSG